MTPEQARQAFERLPEQSQRELVDSLVRLVEAADKVLTKAGARLADDTEKYANGDQA